MSNRINNIIFIFTALFIALIIRIHYFQTVKRETYTYQAVKQRAIDTTLKIVRGNIYDRNMIPFTNVEEELHVIAVPNLIKETERASEILTTLTGLEYSYIKSKLGGKEPATFTIVNMNDKYVEDLKENPGIKMLTLSKRYGEFSLSRHLIGYVNAADQSGSSGIEKIFNDTLTMNQHQNIEMIGDASKRLIPGLGYRITNYFSESQNKALRLALDFHLQKIIEEVMDKDIKSGAVILTDVKTGDILALGSRPNFSQNKIGEHLKSNKSELMNKALSAYDIGSVFKIIVAAAALEGRTVSPEHVFNCTGFIEVDGMNFGCFSKQNGHGEIDFRQAFAESCNSVFIDVGLKTGYKAIVDMARRFGLGSSNNVIDGLAQQGGYIPSKKYISLRETANISIGQGEILVTPIQIVDLVMTIANDGIKKKINVVDAVISNTGDILESFRKKDDRRIISASTAQVIKEMMHDVTVKGTGVKANLDEYGGIAGKTGSAETGWVVDGEAKVHAWFAGYFPVDSPKYAMVVFAEDGRQGGSAAAPVFREIAERVISLNR